MKNKRNFPNIKQYEFKKNGNFPKTGLLGIL